MKKIKFDGNEIPCSADMTIEQAQNWAKTAFPAIADAEGRVNVDGDLVFEKKAGTKG